MVYVVKMKSPTLGTGVVVCDTSQDAEDAFERFREAMEARDATGEVTLDLREGLDNAEIRQVIEVYEGMIDKARRAGKRKVADQKDWAVEATVALLTVAK